jgi:hypothetical protein
VATAAITQTNEDRMHLRLPEGTPAPGDFVPQERGGLCPPLHPNITSVPAYVGVLRLRLGLLPITRESGTVICHMRHKIENGRSSASKFVRVAAAMGLASLLGVACTSGGGFEKYDYSSATVQTCGKPSPLENARRLTTVPNSSGHEFVLTTYVDKQDPGKVRFGLPHFPFDVERDGLQGEVQLKGEGGIMTQTQLNITRIVQATIAITHKDLVTSADPQKLGTSNISAHPGGDAAACISLDMFNP